MAVTLANHLEPTQPAQPALAAVEAWLAGQPASARLTWCAFADPDGDVGLMPSGPDSGTCWPILFTKEADGCAVMICDADDPLELGVFSSIEAALSQVGCWMVSGNAVQAGAARPFRS